MITIGSTYWPLVHGMTPDEVKQDEEGLQAMRNLARNMAWLIKCINAGKEKEFPFLKQKPNMLQISSDNTALLSFHTAYIS